MKNLLLLFCVVILSGSCKKSSTDDPAANPASTYFIQLTFDGVDYKFDGAGATVINTINNVASPRFEVAQSNTANSTSMAFLTKGNLSGKPETVPIAGGNFYKSRFEQYFIGFNPSNGVCTITKIDNTEVEGTFNYDVYDGTKKYSVTNGKFKLKFSI